MESKLDLSKLKSMGDKEQARCAMIVMAKAAEKMELFGDMCQVVRELVKLVASQRKDLTSSERRLTATAFKNIAGQLRGAWRALWTEDKFVEQVDSYKSHVQQELTAFCTTTLDLVVQLERNASLSTESKVFTLKLQGDFCRYLAEIAKDTGSTTDSNGTKASNFYSEATELAELKLEPTHPLRLGVALNFAVCHREIFSDTKQACQLAKKAFNMSIARLDDVEDDEYNDTTLIMQLLRDNLTLWASESG